MSKYEKRLIDEIKEAKCMLYGLLFLSTEAKIYEATDNEQKLMETLRQDAQIKELFKPKTNGDEPK